MGRKKLEARPGLDRDGIETALQPVDYRDRQAPIALRLELIHHP